MSRRKEFLRFIAYIQVICIILVVFGHSFHEHDAHHGTDMLVYRMMYSFRMPAFAFVSGFLMIHTAGLSWLGFVRMKLRRLLLPFAVLSVLVMVPRYFFNFMADDAAEISLGALVHADRLPIPFFWFLQMSFLLLVTGYGVVVAVRSRSASDKVLSVTLCGLLVLSLCLIGYEVGGGNDVFAIKDAIRLWPYFIMGELYCLNRQAVDSVVRWPSPAVAGTIAALWCAAFFLVPPSGIGGVVCSAAGVSMCLSLARLLTDRGGVRVLDMLIGYSYAIFLLSWFVNVATQQMLHYFTDFPWWIYTLLSFSGGIVLPCLAVRTLRRSALNGRVARILLYVLGQTVPPLHARRCGATVDIIN